VVADVPYRGRSSYSLASSMDGDIDYTALSRAQLAEALTRIDKVRYPRNYENLVRELSARPPDSPQQSRPVTLLAVIGRYTLSLVMLEVTFGVLLGEVRLYVFHGSFDHILGLYLLVKVLAIGAIALAVYVHLAKHHHVSFPKAAAGVVVAVSLFSPFAAYFDPHAKTFRPLLVLVTTLLFNLLIAYVAGRLSGWRRSGATPVNNRWSVP
jgi:hypothetical protein